MSTIEYKLLQQNLQSPKKHKQVGAARKQLLLANRMNEELSGNARSL